MNKLEQAARQVLEWYDGNVDGASLAFAALREALAEQVDEIDWIETNKALAKEIIEMKKQAEQEPVAWMDLHKELGKLRWMGGDEGWDNAINAVRDRLIELATPRPVRTKDLTDDEIHKAFYSKNTGLINGIRAVIAADREKNK